MSEDETRIMYELVEEHRLGRKKVAELVGAKTRYVAGETSALPAVIDCLRYLADFYPRHIEKEDKHFFIPCMAYFSKEEKEVLLSEELEFDKVLIHQLYSEKIELAKRLISCA